VSGPAPVAPAPMILRGFYLRHGETYTPGVNVGGVPSSLSFWDREKHGGFLVCEEQKNGDIWLTNSRGIRIEISVLAISYKVRGPEVLKGVEAVRRGA
jgi:hypothetical protein